MRKHSLDCSILLILFLIASIKCVSDLRNDFVAVFVVVILDAELLSRFYHTLFSDIDKNKLILRVKSFST